MTSSNEKRASSSIPKSSSGVQLVEDTMIDGRSFLVCGVEAEGMSRRRRRMDGQNDGQIKRQARKTVERKDRRTSPVALSKKSSAHNTPSASSLCIRSRDSPAVDRRNDTGGLSYRTWAPSIPHSDLSQSLIDCTAGHSSQKWAEAVVVACMGRYSRPRRERHELMWCPNPKP